MMNKYLKIIFVILFVILLAYVMVNLKINTIHNSKLQACASKAELACGYGKMINGTCVGHESHYDYPRFDCYLDLAMQTGSSKSCDRIESTELDASLVILFREDCLDKATRRLAVIKKNEVICSNLKSPTSKDSCYISVAAVKNDPKICSNVSNATHPDACLFEIAKANADISFCDSFTDQNKKDRCILDIAKASMNLKLCANIEDAVLREYCSDWS